MKAMLRALAGAVLAAMLATGCASSSGGGRANELPARPQGTAIIVVGNVSRPVVPYQDGLSLMQAFAMSGYLGTSDPAQLVIHRKGQLAIFVVFADLSKQDMLLNPGDQVEIRMEQIGIKVKQ